MLNSANRFIIFNHILTFMCSFCKSLQCFYFSCIIWSVMFLKICEASQDLVTLRGSNPRFWHCPFIVGIADNYLIPHQMMYWVPTEDKDSNWDLNDVLQRYPSLILNSYGPFSFSVTSNTIITSFNPSKLCLCTGTMDTYTHQLTVSVSTKMASVSFSTKVCLCS